MKAFKIKGTIKIQDDYCTNEQKAGIRLAEAMEKMNGIFEGTLKPIKMSGPVVVTDNVTIATVDSNQLEDFTNA